MNFTDAKYFSAAKKAKAYKTFKRVLEARNSNLIDNNLYEHLHLHCGFIAHYNLHGFRQEYLSNQGFLHFVRHIMNYPYLICRDEYHDINQELRSLALEHWVSIVFEFENEQTQKEIKLLKRLAEKYRFRLVSASADQQIDEEDAFCAGIEKDGQLTIGI